MTRVRLVLLALAIAAAACRSRIPAGSAGGDAAPMGRWEAWGDLTPLAEIAKDHAPDHAANAIARASALLRERKAATADRLLAEASGGAGHHWIAVARADLAALHFTLCIRGVALRLTDGETPSPTDRQVDFSEATRVAPGDVSVEATLMNLDAAVAVPEPALATQARIARARVASFAQQCAANERVAEMAREVAEADLATLAAEGHLTPDLSYMWAGVQMTRFSGAAARPFLLQAQEAGFDHPAVTFMLAVIALDNRDFDRAEELAIAAGKRYAASKDAAHQAEALFLRGEIARGRNQLVAARRHYADALGLVPTHGASLLARAQLDAATDSESAIAGLQQGLATLLLTGPLDAERARVAAQNVEELLVLATEPHEVQLLRDALLGHIDNESDAMRRGLRYFFAAMLDVRLREYQFAQGHGVLAKDEFAQSGVTPPIDIEAFLERLRNG
jgi:tetratricopeptide (TPR) repeat protein